MVWNFCVNLRPLNQVQLTELEMENNKQPT